MFVYLFVCLFIYLFICLFIYLFICLFIRGVYLFICLFIRGGAKLSTINKMVIINLDYEELKGLL